MYLFERLGETRKRERGRERWIYLQIFHLLAVSPNDYDSQVWVRLKPGAGNYPALSAGMAGPRYWARMLCFPWHTSRKLDWNRVGRTGTCTLLPDMGTASDGLASCATTLTL